MTDDVVDDDSDEVIENVTMCSECNEYKEHEILKERKVGTGRRLIGKMQNLHSNKLPYKLENQKSVSMPFILIDGPNSTRVELEIDEDEEFVIGDVFEEKKCYGQSTK